MCDIVGPDQGVVNYAYELKIVVYERLTRQELLLLVTLQKLTGSAIWDSGELKNV